MEQIFWDAMSKTHPRIGDIFYANLSGAAGSEQRGRRPCLILSNNKGNLYSPNLIVLPLTSALKKLSLPTHVLLLARETGLPVDSMVLAEQPACISKERLGSYITTLSPERHRDVAVAHLLSTSAIAYVELEQLKRIRVEAARYNDDTAEDKTQVSKCDLKIDCIDQKENQESEEAGESAGTEASSEMSAASR